jgi:Tfp pilus assembly protein PilV
MKRAGTKRSSRSAFSMVEVIVSGFLIALVMAGAITLVARSMTLSRVARNHYVAISIWKNRLERARTLQYESLSLLAENNVVVDDNGTPAAGGSFSRTTTVNTNFSTDPAVKLTAITVTVKIRDKSGLFLAEDESSESIFADMVFNK